MPPPRWWGIYLRGFAMGLADLVPGVSGGTIAFITGIYDRLLRVIRLGSSPLVLLILLRGQVRIFWNTVDGNFICILFAGIATAILLGIEVLHVLLTDHLIPLLAFFSGLTLGAAFHLLRSFKLFHPKYLLVGLVGIAAAWGVQAFDPIQLSGPPNLQAYFASGAIALCMMILPGISGSLILLLLGIYPFLVEAVRARELAEVAAFGSGGIVGLVLFSHLLVRLLRTHPKLTVAVLVGVMLGSLPRLWPWRDGVGSKAILHAPVAPMDVDEPRLIVAGICFGVGLVLIGISSWAGRRMQK